MRVAIDYDRLLISGLPEEKALIEMRANQEEYSPVLLDALEAVAKIDQRGDVQLLMFDELQEGHVLRENLYTKSGALLIKKGKENDGQYDHIATAFC